MIFNDAPPVYTRTCPKIASSRWFWNCITYTIPDRSIPWRLMLFCSFSQILLKRHGIERSRIVIFIYKKSMSSWHDDTPQRRARLFLPNGHEFESGHERDDAFLSKNYDFPHAARAAHRHAVRLFICRVARWR